MSREAIRGIPDDSRVAEEPSLLRFRAETIAPRNSSHTREPPDGRTWLPLALYYRQLYQ